MTRKLSKETIKNLPVGKSISSEGLEVRKTLKGAVYYASSQVNGCRIRDKIGCELEGMNLTKARKALIQLKQKIPTSFNPVVGQPSVTFKDAADLYIKTLEESGGKNLKQKKQQLKMHLAPYFSAKKIKALSTLEIQRYTHGRTDAGPSVATINRELATLQHMLNSLDDWGVVETGHIKVSKVKGEKRRIMTFDQNEIRLLLDASKTDCDPYTHFFVFIGLQTSMRHSEILRIRFEDCDYENNVLNIPEGKTGYRRVEVTDGLLDMVKNEAVHRGTTKGYLFAAVSKTGHRSYMKKQFNRCLERAGLSDRGFTPHSMRHTAISVMMRAEGVSIADAMMVSGHKTPQMLLHYTHHSKGSVSKAVKALENITT